MPSPLMGSREVCNTIGKLCGNSLDSTANRLKPPRLERLISEARPQCATRTSEAEGMRLANATCSLMRQPLNHIGVAMHQCLVAGAHHVARVGFARPKP